MSRAIPFLAFLLFMGLHVYAQPADIDVHMVEPRDLVRDGHGNFFFAMKQGLGMLTADGMYENLANWEGGKILTMISYPQNLLIDAKGVLYLCEQSTIKKIVVGPGKQLRMENWVGNDRKNGFQDGTGDQAIFTDIAEACMDAQGDIYLLDDWRYIKDQLKGNFITDAFFNKDKTIKYPRQFKVLRKVSPSGQVTTLHDPSGRFILPNGVFAMACNKEGRIFYTTGGISRSVECIDPGASTITHIAGKPYKRATCPVYITGDTSKAELFSPEYIVVAPNGDLVVADERANRITRISNGKVIPMAGANTIDPCVQNIGGRSQEGLKDGKGTQAWFNYPKGLVYDDKGNLYIADEYNNCIRMLDPDNNVHTLTKAYPSSIN